MGRKAHVVAGLAGIATAAGLVALMAPGQGPAQWRFCQPKAKPVSR